MSPRPALIALFFGLLSTRVQSSYLPYNGSAGVQPTAPVRSPSGTYSPETSQYNNTEPYYPSAPEPYQPGPVYNNKEPCYTPSQDCNRPEPYYPYSNHSTLATPSPTNNGNHPYYPSGNETSLTGPSAPAVPSQRMPYGSGSYIPGAKMTSARYPVSNITYGLVSGATSYPAPTGYPVVGPTQYLPVGNTTATVTISQPCPTSPHTTYTAPPIFIPTQGPSNHTTVTVIQPCPTCPATVYFLRPTLVSHKHVTPTETTLTVVESCYACPTTYYGGSTVTGNPAKPTSAFTNTVSETRTLVVSQSCSTCPASSSLIKTMPSAVPVPIVPDHPAITATNTVTILYPCNSCPATTITTSKPTATPVAPGTSRSMAPFPMINSTSHEAVQATSFLAQTGVSMSTLITTVSSCPTCPAMTTTVVVPVTDSGVVGPSSRVQISSVGPPGFIPASPPTPAALSSVLESSFAPSSAPAVSTRIPGISATEANHSVPAITGLPGVTNPISAASGLEFNSAPAVGAATSEASGSTTAFANATPTVSLGGLLSSSNLLSINSATENIPALESGSILPESSAPGVGTTLAAGSSGAFESPSAASGAATSPAASAPSPQAGESEDAASPSSGSVPSKTSTPVFEETPASAGAPVKTPASEEVTPVSVGASATSATSPAVLETSNAATATYGRPSKSPTSFVEHSNAASKVTDSAVFCVAVVAFLNFI